MSVKITQIATVETHPSLTHLSVYTLKGMDGIQLVSMKVDDQHRYQLGEWVAHIPPESVFPEWLLKRLDFWNADKNKGTLGGSKGNRLKARTFSKGNMDEVVSEGMLYPLVNGTVPNSEMFLMCLDTENACIQVNDFSADYASALGIQ